MCIQINECMNKILISYLQYKVKFIYMIFPVLGLLSPPSQVICHTTKPIPTLSLSIFLESIYAWHQTYARYKPNDNEQLQIEQKIHTKILLSCTSHRLKYLIMINFKLSKVFRVFGHDFKDHFTRDWSVCTLT